jgi:superfamily II DNA or RNA helicase
MSNNTWWFPDETDPDFYTKLHSKKEYGTLITTDTTTTTQKGLAPHQRFVKNYISPNTPYDSLLLFHALGTGKTCSAISIAENFKVGGGETSRVIVLVKNQTIVSNFRKEITSQFCTNNTYLTPEERAILDAPEGDYVDTKEAIRKKVKRRISRAYEFITFGVFVNRVLGIKLTTLIDDLEDVGTGVGGGGPSKKKSRSRARVQQPSSIDPDVPDPGDEFAPDSDDEDEIRRRIVGGTLENLSNKVIIIDEAHNIFSNEMYDALTKVLKNSYNVKLILLTATPMYDSLVDIPELINLLLPQHDKNRLPIRKDFLSRGIIERAGGGGARTTSRADDDGDDGDGGDTTTTTRNRGSKRDVFRLTPFGKEVVSNLLRGRVSYVGLDAKTFPARIDFGTPLFPNRKHSLSVVECPMSPYQTQIYIEAERKDRRSASDGIGWMINASYAATMVFPDEKYGNEGFNLVADTKASRRLAGAVTSSLDDIIGTTATSRKKRGVSAVSSVSSVKKKYEKVFGADIGKYSSKIQLLIGNIHHSPGTVFVYSQFINNGITLVRFALQAHGFIDYALDKRRISGGRYKFVLVDGSVSNEKRQEILRVFNSPENKTGLLIRVLLGTPALAEGITLKNVRQIHILEPPWNMSSLNQIIGRGIRTNSHKDLPPEDRNVHIFKYVSVIPPPSPDGRGGSASGSASSGTTIDQAKYRVCEEKDRSIKEFERILKEIAIDCKYKSVSYNASDNFSAKCDYKICDYECPTSTSFPNHSKDWGTFITNLSPDEIFEVKEIVKELFREEPLWTLDTLVAQPEFRQFDKLVLYKALEELVSLREPVKTKFNKRGFVAFKNGYYIFNPEGDPVASSFYRKTTSASKVYPNREDALDSVLELLEKPPSATTTTTTATPSRPVTPVPPPGRRRPVPTVSPVSPVIDEDEIKRAPIYGMVDADGIFKLIDNRNATDAEKKRKRGSLCASAGFKVADLASVFKELTGEEPHPSLKKAQLCVAIQTELERKGLVIVI